jgi:hypothetical protein
MIEHELNDLIHALPAVSGVVQQATDEQLS